MVLAFVVPSGVEAPRQVRDEVRRRLQDSLDTPLVTDLELLVSEVVTNAVRYGGGGGADDIGVRVEVTDDGVSVCISDTGTGFSPARQPKPRFTRGAGGFGLFLLDQLSTRWGIERHEHGFRVWFRLAGRAGARGDRGAPRAAAPGDAPAPNA